MCELGRRLKEARESKGLELAEAAEALRVRRAVLEALEECRFDELPEPALARGYLKRYAQLLGLEPAPLLALYPSSAPAEPTGTPSPPPRTFGWFWLLPLALLLALGAWWVSHSSTPSQAPP
ncbi:helix-turn-helix domain-containing protein, partial [Meiothermus luteus]|uniref:helix-turn-helix domain-containing protein n=1 Tax=Meiothermus luteus TaxID=2026184 RepID=UPI0011C36401